MSSASEPGSKPSIKIATDDRGGHVLSAIDTSGRVIGRLECGLSGPQKRFAFSYMEVASASRGKGVGRTLLDAALPLVPDGLDRVDFYQVTSLGMLKLLESVFGELRNDGPLHIETIRERLPDAMDLRRLRSSRGHNLWAERPSPINDSAPRGP